MSVDNKQLLIIDTALVKDQSQVTVGTIFKGWRGSKGLDYMITGIDTSKKEIYAVKHNSVNQDGTINTNVKRHKRVLKYTETPSKTFGLVKGITSILGQKESINAKALNDFNKAVNTDISILGFKTIGLYSQPVDDFRTKKEWS